MKHLSTYRPHSTPRAPGAPRGTYTRTSEATELAVCADYRSGMTLKRIALKHNVREVTIYRIIDKHEVERRKKDKSVDDFTLAECLLLDSIRNGSSIESAARRRGFTVSAAETIIARAKFACRL